ncbi:MAG TPA: serine hydrolase [Ideonella sp.]|uniref:serine hydrolase n=1 Tax=Ideonella sp. TaxID=1929293 RepID=UPI002E31AC1A|nr:serine hydrolase [Ideonella sp.]HEX5685895.1 serine hydrolase [Ideonella sp.]
MIAGLVALALNAGAQPGPTDWAPLDAAVRGQMAAGAVPGAVVIVGDAQHVWLRRAWGLRAAGPQPEPMTADTVFDLASLTKVVCTTTAVLQLVERDSLQLDAPAARYWPAFAAAGKGAITVRQLLSHSSGLRPGLTLRPTDDAAAVWKRLLAETPVSAPGSRYLYSDLNFLALGVLVQRVAGRSLEAQCQRRVFEPLQMHDTGFRPPRRLAPRIAPTEPMTDGWLRGTVQDPTARRAGGVAGHAGLFGSADDLARFAQAMLRAGPTTPLFRGTINDLQRPQGAASATGWHGLGWSLIAPLQAEREALPAWGAVGHTGYTGTGIWLDFTHRRFVVLLTSRLHPDGRGDARPLRRQVLALVASLQPPSPQDGEPPLYPQAPRPDDGPAPVWTGIDVLRQQGYAMLQGRRIGLVTHSAAIDRHGWRTLDRLRHAPGVRLVRLFTPEHGLNADAEGRIDAGTEPFSGLPIVSLYGATQRPAPETLQDLDTLVIDLQDAGVRFYTYLATLGECLRAAAKAGIQVVVLDRPDPARADRVAGPKRDPGLQSFTAYAALPVQHGMTIGELARYLAAELKADEGLSVDLQVVAMRGYRRAMDFESTGLDWVPPSPNLRRPDSARLYPGVAWVEGAPVSVGRGTDHPFEWVGAPWIDGDRLAQVLAEQQLPGVAVRAIQFVPKAAPHAGQRCEGVALRVTDRERFDASLLGAALVQALHRLWPRQFFAERTIGMVGSAQTLQQLRDGLPPAQARERWEKDWGDFLQRRAAALLYEGSPLPRSAAQLPPVPR